MIIFARFFRWAVVVIGIFWLLSACITTRQPCCQFDWIPQLNEVNPKYTKDLTLNGERNKVFNLMNIGGKLFSEGHYSLSQKLFMEASLEIDNFYGMTPKARQLRKQFFMEATKEALYFIEAAEKAGSPYYREAVKFFRGEPYERMMVYYYLGVSYLLKGDYENAHAAFINSQSQDAIAEEQQHQSDFPPLEGLLYFTARARKMSSSVQDMHRKRLQKLRSGLKINHLKAPLIVIVESGKGPTKNQQGKHKNFLSFSRGADEVSEVNVVLGGQTLSLIKSGDLYWQATTRGGRGIDGLLAQKALWKDEWSQRGKNAFQIYTQLADKAARNRAEIAKAEREVNNNNLPTKIQSQSTGPAHMAFGKIMEKSIYPEADNRTWDTLPAHIWLGTINPGSSDHVTIEYKKGDSNLSKRVNIYKGQNNTDTGVVWLKIN